MCELIILLREIFSGKPTVIYYRKSDIITKRYFSLVDKCIYAVASGFMQLAAAGRRRNKVHCLFEGKC